MVKKITITLLLAFCIAMSLKGQVYTGGGIGIGIQSTSMVGELNLGYRIPFEDCPQYSSFSSGLFIQGGFIAQMNAGEAAIFYGKLGKGIRMDWSSHLEIAAGYSYHLKSADNKSLNSSGGIYSLAWVKSVGIGEIVPSLTYSNGILISSISIRILFIGKKYY